MNDFKFEIGDVVWFHVFNCSVRIVHRYGNGLYYVYNGKLEIGRPEISDSESNFIASEIELSHID